MAEDRFRGSEPAPCRIVATRRAGSGIARPWAGEPDEHRQHDHADQPREEQDDPAQEADRAESPFAPSSGAHETKR